MNGLVADGLALIETFPEEELELSTVIDRLEAVSSDPRVIRSVLERADDRGLIDRAERTVRVTAPRRRTAEAAIVSREGRFECRRCGTGMGVGYFCRLETGELGPYGSTCIRRVTGRDP